MAGHKRFGEPRTDIAGSKDDSYAKTKAVLPDLLTEEDSESKS